MSHSFKFSPCCAEIEQTSNAYEDMQSQNTRLLQQLTERDEAMTALAAEKLQLQQGSVLLSEQLSAVRGELTSLKKELSDMGALKEAVEKDMAKLNNDLALVRLALMFGVWDRPGWLNAAHP